MEHLNFELANLVDLIHTMIEKGIDLDLTTSGIYSMMESHFCPGFHCIAVCSTHMASTNTCCAKWMSISSLIALCRNYIFVFYSYFPIIPCFWNISVLLWNWFCLLVSHLLNFMILYFLEDGRYFKAWFGYYVLSKLVFCESSIFFVFDFLKSYFF